MMYDIREIKEIRRKFGLTQAGLAELAGVSQSLIAKIESNNIDPTYSRIKNIFEAIDKLQHIKEVKASEIMNANIISLKADDTLKHATKIMRKKGFSQLLVIQSARQPDVVIGLISEAKILEAMMNKADPESRIKEYMADCPPIVGKDTGLSIVGSLLKFYPMVIVKEKGKTIGIITKSDILGIVYK